MSVEVPKQDMHVHSTFSDGNNTIEENIEEAESLGNVAQSIVTSNHSWMPAAAPTLPAATVTTRTPPSAGSRRTPSRSGGWAGRCGGSSMTKRASARSVGISSQASAASQVIQATTGWTPRARS